MNQETAEERSADSHRAPCAPEVKPLRAAALRRILSFGAGLQAIPSKSCRPRLQTSETPKSDDEQNYKTNFTKKSETHPLSTRLIDCPRTT